MASIDWKQVIKSPQSLVSLAAAAVVSLGTAGIISESMSGALQTLLVAVLGVVTAAGHTTVTAKVAAKQDKPALVPPAPGSGG